VVPNILLDASTWDLAYHGHGAELNVLSAYDGVLNGPFTSNRRVRIILGKKRILRALVLVPLPRLKHGGVLIDHPSGITVPVVRLLPQPIPFFLLTRYVVSEEGNPSSLSNLRFKRKAEETIDVNRTEGN
jgi:hypothetical protein